jgi:hypothetical protein
MMRARFTDGLSGRLNGSKKLPHKVLTATKTLV